jgi:hypothetical protein
MKSFQSNLCQSDCAALARLATDCIGNRFAQFFFGQRFQTVSATRLRLISDDATVWLLTVITVSSAVYSVLGKALRVFVVGRNEGIK